MNDTSSAPSYYFRLENGLAGVYALKQVVSVANIG